LSALELVTFEQKISQKSLLPFLLSVEERKGLGQVLPDPTPWWLAGLGKAGGLGMTKASHTQVFPWMIIIIIRTKKPPHLLRHL